MSKNLFFIALLPPLNIQQEAYQIKQYFAEVYNSKAALKSPPHITLQPPFYWEVNRLLELKVVLQEFAQQQVAFSITLDGFAAFKPRVIYINVIKTAQLLLLQKELSLNLESSLDLVREISSKHSFNPHLTVGFKDLTKANFERAWTEFSPKPYSQKFMATRLTLLQHNGQEWKLNSEFDFRKESIIS
jgi:2'-5' RNA ligase